MSRGVVTQNRKKRKLLALEKRLMLDASLPAIAGQVLWLDAADASTIQDADGDSADTGTGGNNDGFSGSVATWQDKSASGFDVTAGGTEQPVYGLDTQNGLGVITFDGSNDRLTSGDTITGDDVTMFIVYNRTSSTGRDAVFELGNNSTSRNGLFLFANNTIQYYSSGAFDAASGTYALGNYHLASIVHDQTNIDTWMNGTNVLSTTTNARTDATSITVGDDVTSGDEMTGTVAEILVYDRDLTSDERHDIENYLAAKWDLTITNTAPTLDTNAGITLDEGTALTITNAELASSDVDNSDGNLSYTITDLVDNGILTNTNTAQTLGINDTFTQSDIDNGYILYTHDGSSTIMDAFSFDVSDGLDSVAGVTFNITVNPVGTEADVLAIPNAVFQYDAQDIDADGDTADQPADGSGVNQIRNAVGTTDTASQGNGSRQPIYDEDAFGYQKGGLVYDGSNDYTTIPNDNLINTSSYAEKSFAVAFRTGADVNGVQMIYEQGGGSNGYNIAIVNGNLYAYAWGESYWSGADRFKSVNLGAVNPNETYTVIVVHDATGATIDDRTFSANVNGGAFTTLTRADVMGGHSGDAVLGRSGNSQRPDNNGNLGGGSHFEGALGEIWSWNHALTAGEISDVQDYLDDKWRDETPVTVTNSTLDVVTDSVISITNADLFTTDVEVPDTLLTYTVTSLPSEGVLYRSGIALGVNDTFTQDDINNGLILFDHDGTAAPSADSFGFTVSDGYNAPVAGTFNFDIVAQVGSSPILVANNLVTLNEGTSTTITDADLDTDDLDTTDPNLTYTVTSAVSSGTLFRNGVALNVNDTFTQQDIVDGLVTYTHDNSENLTDNFIFTVSDGTVTLSATTFNFAITGVNDQAPTAIALSSTSINENSSNGTVIGTLSTTDADMPGDSFTYSIVSDPDSKFVIVGDELRVNGSLNHENSGSHSVTVRVNDGAFTFDRLFNITVLDINENPTDLLISNTDIVENSANGTVIGTLSATDPDQPGDTFTYTITSDPDNKFTIFGNELRVNDLLDFEASASHSVSIRVTDGNGGQRTENYTINVTPTNDIPVLSTTDTSLSQGETVVLTPAILSATDQDNVDTGLIFEVTVLPANGTLFLNATPLGINDTFTQQDIIDGNVTYVHDNTAQNASDSFDIHVTDGALTTASQTITLNMDVYRQANNAETLAEGGTDTIETSDLQYEIAWYDSNWPFRREITVDSTLVNADLTDYPLLISEAGFDASFWANVKNDGTDIVVTDANGNKLDRELVSIDTVGETMQLYVRTDLSSTTDTTFYLYYGNAAGAETNAATTWATEYQGVWHFDDDFNDGDAADSSQAGNDGIAGNGFDNTNQVAGVTGGGVEFNNSEYLALNYSYQGNNTLPEISVSAWINTTETGGSQSANWAILDFDRSDFFNVYIHQNGTVGFSTAANGSGIDDFYSTGVTVNDGNWHHIAAVYDGTDKILYVNGVEVARDTNSHGGRDLGTNNTRFGFIGDGSEATSFNAGRNNVYYDGLYDNIRFYEGVWDGAWVAAEHANHNTPNTFYSVGAQDQKTVSTLYTLTGLPSNGTLFIDANSNNVIDGGEALGLNDTFTQNDIDLNLLRYQHNGGETTSDSFDFTVENGGGDTTTTQTYNFTITPVNDAPTNILPSATDIDENSANGTVIANLSTVDVDLPGDSFIYSITADPDSKFSIAGNQLLVNGALNAEAAGSHSVTIQTDDQNGGVITRNFSITVNDINEAPTDILADNLNVDENSSGGTLIANLSGIDEDLPGDAFVYSIVADPGNKFNIVGNQLVVSGSLDFEATSSHSVSIQIDDQNGGLFTKNFTVNVLDVSEPIANTSENSDGSSSGSSESGDFAGDGGLTGNDRGLFQVRDILDPLGFMSYDGLIQATLSGDTDAMDSAFYGEGTMPAGMESPGPLQPVNIAPAEPAQQNQGPSGFNPEEIIDPEKYTNIRSSMDFLRELASQDNTGQDTSDDGQEDDENASRTIEDQFEDVLMYHEKRKEALRQALLN